MSFIDQQNPYASTYAPAIFAEEAERTTFIRRTYAHLAAAIALFIAIEALIFAAVPDATLQSLVGTMTQGYAWLAVVAAFIGVSWVANMWAQSSTSLATQYAGLVLYVVVESVIFIPMLYVAQRFDPSGQLIPAAATLTLVIFGGLTAMVFITRADFGWMGRYLFWAGLVGLGLVICSVFFNMSGLGLLISVGFIGLASAYILYDTSNVLHHYNTTQHVAAALALFASVALLFWYVLRLMMSLQRD